jgi:3-dehydroquinate synthase
MIVTDLYSALKPYLEAVPKGQVFVLTDSNTHKHCMPTLAAAMADVAYETIVVTAGEESKTLAAAEQVWSQLLTKGATREALLVNLGGGVVTDLGGFVASTYMRGIKCVNIPTSLLAMVDASSGGKTGVNFGGVKNLIGSFSLPLASVVYTPFLASLPADEWLSGYAEMLKHGLLDSMEHWCKVMALDVNDNECVIPDELLAENMSVKERIVAADPKEKAVRKLLNLGHTVGHAIEEAYAKEGREVKHGYCVMWGMVAELYLSVIKMGLSREVLRQMTHLMLE